MLGGTGREQTGGAKNLHVATIIGSPNLKSSAKNILTAASEHVNWFASIGVVSVDLLKTFVSA